YLLKRGKTLVNFKFWKFGLVFGIPLVFHNLGLIVNTQFDRIAINNYLGSSETGIYSFAYQVGMIVQVLFISIDQAWNPWFLEKYDNGEYSKIRKRAKIMRNIFTVLYTSVLMISPELVKLMADKSYWEGLYLVPWIFMGYYFVFLYALEVNVEYASKRTGMIATGTIISALINIVLNMIFVPIYGYMAAAVTTLISYVVLFIFHYVITSRIIKSKVYGIKFYLQSIIFVLFITGFFLIFQDSFLLRIFGILIAWGLLYYSLKHELKKIGKGKD
ncbi:lipopolysaccharide biosynthesis protein, partial [Neobacillus mesonae]|uniref:lipopolysaccharide biosynthesis protein n=1 Tax=Neobacillus mesonae TaxID=1193713 RepID=UPI002E1A3A04